MNQIKELFVDSSNVAAVTAEAASLPALEISEVSNHCQLPIDYYYFYYYYFYALRYLVPQGFRFIHSFIQTISIAPLQVHYYSEVLPTDSVSEFHAEAHRQL